MQDLGSSIENLRKKLGLTRLEAAELADGSLRFLHDFENGLFNETELKRWQLLAN